MQSRLTIRRPSSFQEEQRLVYMTRHRCEPGQAMETHDEDPDVLLFPVGVYGAGMPKHIPFFVPAFEPCPACGERPTIVVEWEWNV